MKKLIVKTALITVASVTVFVAALYFVLSTFFPKSLAEFYKGLDNYSLAEKYYEKQYEKTEDREDLFILCSFIDQEKGEGEEYFSAFFGSEKVEEYCAEKDGEITSLISTYDYLAGKYAVIVFLSSDMERAIEVATDLVKNGYTVYSPFRALIDYKEVMTAQDKNLLTQKLTQITANASQSEKVIVQSDIAELLG